MRKRTKFIPAEIEREEMAEGVGFEPTVALRLLLISSQVPLTTQPPFRAPICSVYADCHAAGKTN